MSQASSQHTHRRGRLQTRNQATALAVLGVAVLLILGSLYLSQVASFAITNRAIEDLISRRDQIKRQNEQIIGEIASYRTVPRLYARAVALGFSPATNADIDYLYIPGYQPQREAKALAAADAKAAAPVAPAYDQTFSGWLEQQFALLRAQFESFGE